MYCEQREKERESEWVGERERERESRENYGLRTENWQVQQKSCLKKKKKTTTNIDFAQENILWKLGTTRRNAVQQDYCGNHALHKEFLFIKKNLLFKNQAMHAVIVCSENLEENALHTEVMCGWSPVYAVRYAQK